MATANRKNWPISIGVPSSRSSGVLSGYSSNSEVRPCSRTSLSGRTAQAPSRSSLSAYSWVSRSTLARRLLLRGKTHEQNILKLAVAIQYPLTAKRPVLHLSTGFPNHLFPWQGLVKRTSICRTSPNLAARWPRRALDANYQRTPAQNGSQQRSFSRHAYPSLAVMMRSFQAFWSLQKRDPILIRTEGSSLAEMRYRAVLSILGLMLPGAGCAAPTIPHISESCRHLVVVQLAAIGRHSRRRRLGARSDTASPSQDDPDRRCRIVRFDH